MEFDDRNRLEISLKRIFEYHQFEEKYYGDDILLKQIIDELDLYLNWLANLKMKYNIKQDYPLQHIAEQIFVGDFFAKDNFKYHIAAMYFSVNEIRKNLYELLKNDKDNADKITISAPKYLNVIKGQLALLNDLIIDFNELYWKIEEYFYGRERDKADEAASRADNVPYPGRCHVRGQIEVQVLEFIYRSGSHAFGSKVQRVAGRYTASLVQAAI